MQTSYGDTPLMQQICTNDYRAFFDQQMFERQTFHYPPYHKLIRVVIRHRDATLLNKGAYQLASALRGRFGSRVLGPDAPAVGRIQNMYIKHLLLKIEITASFERAKSILDEIIAAQMQKEGMKGLHIYLDVDPM